MTSFTPSNPPSTALSSSSAILSERSIPHHPAPNSAAATYSGVPVDSQMTSSTGAALGGGAVSEGEAKQADTPAARHAMEAASQWMPSLERRQSWSKEDQKRELQMTGLTDGGSNEAGAGFSERRY